MTSWFKTGLWTPKVTPDQAQKLPARTSGPAAKPSSNAPRGDKLENRKSDPSTKLTQAGNSAGVHLTRPADGQAVASHRAATVNDLLADPGVDPASKAEAASKLKDFPPVAVAPVEGTKLTVLEHALARLNKSQPATRKGVTDAESPEHLGHFLDAYTLVQQYAKLTGTPVAGKIAEILGKAAQTSLRSGARGHDLTVGLLQTYQLARGPQRRQDGVRAVSRSLSQGGDAVQAAEQHVHADLEKALGGKANLAKACKIPEVETYRREAVAELVLAGAAHQVDIPVADNCFGRDGRVRDAVRSAAHELWEVHTRTAELRAAEGDATPSPTFAAQQGALSRLTGLLGLFGDKQVPNLEHLREHLADSA